MLLLRNLSPLVLSGLICAAPAPGETAKSLEQRQIEGRHILRQAVEALGGDAFLNMRDRIETGWSGTFRRDVTRHVRTRIYTMYPGPGEDEIRERQTFNKDESHALLFNETGGYEITFRGVRPLTEEQLERFHRDVKHNVLHILHHHLDDRDLIFEYAGTEVCENQSADVVAITNAGNDVLKVCFSRATHLPIRQSYVRRDEKTRERIEEVMVFSRYFDAGNGIQWPRHIEQLRDGEKISERFLESVAVNQNLSPKIFELPPDVELLKPVRFAALR